MLLYLQRHLKQKPQFSTSKVKQCEGNFISTSSVRVMLELSVKPVCMSNLADKGQIKKRGKNEKNNNITPLLFLKILPVNVL